MYDRTWANKYVSCLCTFQALLSKHTLLTCSWQTIFGTSSAIQYGYNLMYEKLETIGYKIQDHSQKSAKRNRTHHDIRFSPPILCNHSCDRDMLVAQCHLRQLIYDIRVDDSSPSSWFTWRSSFKVHLRPPSVDTNVMLMYQPRLS